MSYAVLFAGVALIAGILALGSGGAAAAITWSVSVAAIVLAVLFAFINHEPDEEERGAHWSR